MLLHEEPFPPTVAGGGLTGYQLSGTSPGGIFLHGFRSHCDGEKSIALLQHAKNRGRYWLRFNQRFCGQDNSRFSHFTLSRAIQDTVAVLDWIRQPIVLVGSSLGALVALAAGSQRPEWAHGLLLIAPAIRFFERYFTALPANEIEAWRTSGERSFPDEYTGEAFTLNYGFYQDCIDNPVNSHWKIRCPVTILHGEHDEILPPQDSLELAEAIDAPSVSVRIIAGGDHRLNVAIPLICDELDRLW